MAPLLILMINPRVRNAFIGFASALALLVAAPAAFAGAPRAMVSLEGSASRMTFEIRVDGREQQLVPSVPFAVPSEYLLRPHAIALGGSACSPYLSHLRWLSYGATGARAVGEGVFPVLGPYPDNCSEALARTHARIVHVVLSQPRRCEGILIFTRIGWRARGSHDHSVIQCD